MRAPIKNDYTVRGIPNPACPNKMAGHEYFISPKSV